MKLYRWYLFIILLLLGLASCSPNTFYFVQKATRTPTKPPLPTQTSRPLPTRILPTKTSAVSAVSSVNKQLAFPVIVARSPLTVAHTAGDHYQLQEGSPTSTINFVHPELECKWMSVVGQVFLPDGRLVIGLVVEVSGTLDNLSFTRWGLTGNATAVGPAGFEVRLADYPIVSQNSVKLRLLDLAGLEVADPIIFPTYADCQKNILVINFTKIP